ncbi:MAG: hypothetical protein HFJ84_03370 [Clostridiales bacterium]|jgi:hypothetical protein|nr:hypothetical protein [Clostridiales bacterium]
MRVVKNEKGFPAILKDQQECVLAEGFASVLEESNSVEFRSDFVPLYPMGVPLKVIRQFQNQDIHIFWGEVYISDQKLLRLIRVRDLLVPGSENIYSTLVSMSGTFTERKSAKEPAQEAKPSRFSLFRRKKQEQPQTPSQYPLKLTALSGNSLEFTSPYLLEQGDAVFVSFTPPDSDLYLDNLPVKVEKVYAFGEDIAYVCSFLSMPSWLQDRWNTFIRGLNEKENRFFSAQLNKD